MARKVFIVLHELPRNAQQMIAHRKKNDTKLLDVLVENFRRIKVSNTTPSSTRPIVQKDVVDEVTEGFLLFVIRATVNWEGSRKVKVKHCEISEPPTTLPFTRTPEA